MTETKKVVLAYSGGLDTSVILKWLIEEYSCEVVAFAADLGQGEELDPVRGKAEAAGATEVFIEDLQEEFVRDYVFPMFRGAARYEHYYLLGTSIARPLIAKKQIEIARQTGADSVSHGATGKGNDQVRFELSYYALQPDIKVIAPWRVWDMKSRSDLIAYGEKHGIPVPVTKSKPYSMDRNMLHLSFEGGILEDPWAAPPDDMFILTVDPRKAPDQPREMTIAFEKGVPVGIDGKKLGPADMLKELNRLGGEHGVGRVDLVENRFVGMKSRGVYETPGGTILFDAMRALESITLDREVIALRDDMSGRYARLVYNGFWFAPERVALQNMFDEIAAGVNGEVRLRLYKGAITILGRRSPQSLFDERFATFEHDEVYNQADAEGFIKLNALRLRLRAMLDKA